jgi:hypothetical protein
MAACRERPATRPKKIADDLETEYIVGKDEREHANARDLTREIQPADTLTH